MEKLETWTKLRCVKGVPFAYCYYKTVTSVELKQFMTDKIKKAAVQTHT